MKEESDNLENKIRSKLYSYSEKVPDDLWSKIETKLPAPENGFDLIRSKLTWFALADVMVMLLLVLPFCNTSKISPLSPATSTTQTISNDSSSLGTESSFKQPITSNTNSVNKPIVTMNEGAKEPMHDIAKSTKNQVTSQSSIIPVTTTKSKSIIESSVSAPEILLSSTVTLNSTKPEEPVLSAPLSNATSIKLPSVDSSLNTSASTVNTKQTQTNESVADTVQPLPTVDTNKIKKADNMLLATVAQLPIEKSKSPKLRIEAMLGPDYYFFKNRDNTVPGFSARMDSSTTNQRAISAELLLSYYFTKRVYLKGGLSWSTLSRKYSLVHEQEIKEIYIDSVSNFYSLQDPFNLPLVIKNYDTLITISNTTNQVSSNMQYTLLDIPILAGYDFLLTKVRLGMYTGIRINCLFTKKGTEINPKNYTELDAEMSRTNYKKQLGIGYMIGINAAYEITKNLALTISPYYQTYPTSVFSSEYGLTQNWTKCGIHAGVAYFIKSKK